VTDVSIRRTEELRRGAAGALHVVTYECGTANPRADLLFVHGAWSSSWYWESFFLPWFAQRGFRARAVSLRGHGESEGRVRWSSIRDYVDDVAAAAQGLTDPVLIGHSMGGFVAQKYAARHGMRALALLASVPPSGAWHALRRIIAERPMAFLRTVATLDLYGAVADAETARGLLFSRDASRTDKDHLLQRLKSESFRAFLDMLFSPVLGRRLSNEVPVAVIGAEFDQLISTANNEATARFYGVDPQVLPLASHMLMVDDRWSDAAMLIENWLEVQVLNERVKPPLPKKPSTQNARAAVVDQSIDSSPLAAGNPLPQPRKAKMLGCMQHHPLILSSLLTHAEAGYHGTPIWSREAPTAAGELGVIVRQTWADTASRARCLASALQALGVDEGDRVGSIAWNTHRHLEIYYGVTGIGAVLHTINPRLSLDHLRFMIHEAADEVLFYDGTFAGLVSTLKPLCPGVRHWIQLSRAPVSPDWRDLAYEELLSSATPLSSWPELDENCAAALCYTSGTTGAPKGVLYSHRALVLESMTAIGPDALGLSRSDTVAPVVPMFHVNAWSLPFAAAIAGASLALPGSSLGGEALYDLFETTGTTISAGVPTIWQSLLAHLDSTGAKFSTMRRTIIGGSAVTQPMVRAFRDHYGVEVIHGWGMTETSPLGTVNALTPAEVAVLTPEEAAGRLRRQGRAPFGVRLKLVNSDGHVLPRDGESAGHLMISGHWVIDSYFQGDKATTHDGWFDTGDIATLGTDAVMVITDRDKDLIKSGGEWISSIQLEEIALGHRGVIEAAAIAVPHPRWGERPLVVCVSSGKEAVSTAEVRRLFEDKLPSWQVPEVVISTQLPVGATGKVVKMQLRQAFSHHYENE
jgi:fatty-acyl-CoA synthase